MSDVIDFPAKPPAKQEWLIGPFEYHAVVIEGRRIPRLTAHRTPDGINLIVDDRFCVLLPEDVAADVAWLVANALAVGAGYPCLSAENKDRPFAPKVFQVGSVTTEELP